ncbi:hypothetical protein MNBD_GAMMA23-118 [hydrothermal vent metagenome]|uniref:TRASH domain-containing protein n=1 Tax=hydrothermal vent metagenome TaxID=652676 RepID=A0A3B0ZWG9_9ZZZZ
MNLIRLLVIVAIIWLAYRMYQNWLAKKNIAHKQQTNKPDIENMVQCSKCGIHLPEQEALKQGIQFFCCEAHKK